MKLPFLGYLASFVSSLLNILGVTSVADGNKIFVQSLKHTFKITLPCADYIGIGLWTFIFVFIVWVHASLECKVVTKTKYALLTTVSFATFFTANILRMAFLIFYATLIGYVPSLNEWAALEEYVGIGFMFTSFFILLFAWILYSHISTVKMISKKVRKELKLRHKK